MLLTLACCRAETLRLCLDDQEGADGEAGLQQDPNLAVMQALARETGIQMEFHRRAWLRCQMELRANMWDGAVAASYAPDRLEFAVYPMAHGQADPVRRLGVHSYSLYRLRGSSVGWDGKRFTGINGLVGVQFGYSVTVPMQEAGLRLDDSTRSITQLMQKLLNERVEAIALITWDGDRMLDLHPEWAARVERVDPPVMLKPDYLIFSRGFYSKKRALAEKLWSTLPAVRDALGQ
jgi:polar amino acid transport system substrate-binding protein